MKKKAPNLFGWNPAGADETGRLRALLHLDGFRLVYFHGDTMYFSSPQQYDHRLFGVCANGGELNAGWVNFGEGKSIPSTYRSKNCNGETMFYRLKAQLNGQTINYDKMLPHLDKLKPINSIRIEK